MYLVYSLPQLTQMLKHMFFHLQGNKVSYLYCFQARKPIVICKRPKRFSVMRTEGLFALSKVSYLLHRMCSDHPFPCALSVICSSCQILIVDAPATRAIHETWRSSDETSCIRFNTKVSTQAITSTTHFGTLSSIRWSSFPLSLAALPRKNK